MAMDMDDHFSWMDNLRACLPSCLHVTHSDDEHDDLDSLQQRGGSARDELQSLLFDSDHDHDTTTLNAETMSLRSDIGGRSRRSRRRRRRPAGKTVRVFGFDLFGRPRVGEPSPPPSDDERDDSSSGHRHPTSSLFTLDSDATPLPNDAIANLSNSQNNPDISRWEPTQSEEDLAREEEEQRIKEERRAARRLARKARKVAEAEAEGLANLAAGFTSFGDDEFEGFQGSGGALPPLPRTLMTASSVTADTEGDEFGPYVRVDGGGPEDEPDVPDFGGEYYERKRSDATRNGSGDGSSSRTRSNHSGGAYPQRRVGPVAGGSQLTALNLAAQNNAHLVPLPLSSAGSVTSFQPELQAPPNTRKRSKSKSSKSKPASIYISNSQSGTSQSPSLASPPPHASHFPSPHIRTEHEAHAYEHGLISSHIPREESSSSQGDFPSTGFNAPRRKGGNVHAGLGVALANRG